MDYICEVCGGSEKTAFSSATGGKCYECHGTGEKQITIPLREYDGLNAMVAGKFYQATLVPNEDYDRLKLAEKQRDKAVEILHQRAINLTCSICHENLKQAILSYEEGKK